jgi:hypothetical protein
VRALLAAQVFWLVGAVLHQDVKSRLREKISGMELCRYLTLASRHFAPHTAPWPAETLFQTLPNLIERRRERDFALQSAASTAGQVTEPIRMYLPSIAGYSSVICSFTSRPDQSRHEGSRLFAVTYW